jgi:hypothetical protein
VALRTTFFFAAGFFAATFFFGAFFAAGFFATTFFFGAFFAAGFFFRGVAIEPSILLARSIASPAARGVLNRRRYPLRRGATLV